MEGWLVSVLLGSFDLKAELELRRSKFAVHDGKAAKLVDTAYLFERKS